jgi:paraquat-inducible protein B
MPYDGNSAWRLEVRNLTVAFGTNVSQRDLSFSVGNANDALVAVRQTVHTGDEAIARLRDEASTALRELDALLVDAHHQVGLRGTELSRTLNSADRAARNAAALLESLNGTVQPLSQLRGNLEAAICDLAAAGSLRDFAGTIERNPNGLLLGRGRQ